MTDRRLEDLLRELAPQVLAAMLRRHAAGAGFDVCEDATQEALLAAATQWPAQGVPDNPRNWLVAVAGRRVIDEMRSENARRRREDAVHAGHPPAEMVAAAADAARAYDVDDSLRLLFLCAHPDLPEPGRVALTLRAVGGLTTAQIAAAHLVPEATMAQRISRAKQKLAGRRFELPAEADHRERLGTVLAVLYLVFNEGYSTSHGNALTAVDLSDEAIRLTRMLHTLLPSDPEVTGLLALMLLTDARRPARTGDDGEFVPLEEQDRTRWDRGRIAEGTALLDATFDRGSVGPYAVQAAIAALHDAADSTDVTDWPQILGLYAVLERIAPGPVVSLNKVVAVAQVRGERAALELLDTVAADPRLAGSHRPAAIRAHLLDRLGDPAAADAYRSAARGAGNLRERQYLLLKAAQVGRS
ncbi:RNA polymerase sigma factor [Nakamurella alba]|uniref:RNA polymerase sigma factor n=1 Tax=Nakamurella alba TaxID=2665158 RepID=UPI002AC34355|nr:sigma-70 family RNA polymerase sigma factor [Nakamurella alba]